MGVAVSIDNAAGLVAFEFKLYYDPSLIDAVSVSPTALTAGWAIVGNAGFENYIYVAAATGTPLTAGSGPICEVRFSVSGGAPDGSVSPLDLQGVLVNDIPSTAVDGTFTISCAGTLDCASGPSPVDGAADVPVDAGLSWEAVAAATAYDVYFGVTLPATPAATVTGPAYDPGALFPGTAYRWRVVPRNASGTAAGCPVWTFATVEPPPAAVTQFVAAAARASGAAGSDWRTDGMLYNATGQALSYDLVFTPGGEAPAPLVYSDTLGAGQARMVDNILETLFGVTAGAGNLRLESSQTLRVTTRTYNRTDAGTYGQFIPGVGADRAVGAAAVRVGETGHLLGIQQNADFRTNLGFSEVAGTAASFTLRFYDLAGVLVGSYSGAVPAHGWLQKNLTEMGIASGSDLRAELQVTAGGMLLGYASMVDYKTNDACFIPAQKAADAAGQAHQLFAVVARAQGGYGTDWRTDVQCYNPGSSAQAVDLEFPSTGGTATGSFTLAPQGGRAFKDIVTQEFPQLAGNVSGALHLRSPQGVLCVSRTYNRTDQGTYGQFIPLRARPDLLEAGQTGYLLQLAGNADFRCNIGFTEFAGTAARVKLTLVGMDGQVLGSKTYDIPAGANLQVNAFADLGIGAPVDAARATLEVLSGGVVYGYASVADNRTGDAIFIPAAR